jgi:hypothetical protein
LSIAQPCKLLGLARSSYYYEAAPESEENLHLMRLLDEQYTRTPFYGTRKMTAWLHTQGYPVERKRVRRLLRLMGLEAIYPKPKTSVPGATEQRYPYLLRGLCIGRCNQVWSCDITYIRMPRGFLYLMAVIDWFSRYVVSWELSNTLDTGFCLQALDRALGIATYYEQKRDLPEIKFASSGSGLGHRHPRDFQHRSGDAVHQCRLYQPAQGFRYSHQLGWPRTSLRQHLYRACFLLVLENSPSAKNMFQEYS